MISGGDRTNFKAHTKGEEMTSPTSKRKKHRNKKIDFVKQQIIIPLAGVYTLWINRKTGQIHSYMRIK